MAMDQSDWLILCKCIILHDLEGNTRGIFSSRVAVLARPQGGTIKNLRTEYSPVLSDPKGMLII